MFNNGSFKQAMMILVTGIALAAYTYLSQQATYFDPPNRIGEYPLGLDPMAWGMVAGLIVCAGTGLYVLFDMILGKHKWYQVLRWGVLSFWLAVGITVMIRFYALIQDGTVVPDWSL